MAELWKHCLAMGMNQCTRFSMKIHLLQKQPRLWVAFRLYSNSWPGNYRCNCFYCLYSLPLATTNYIPSTDITTWKRWQLPIYFSNVSIYKLSVRLLIRETPFSKFLAFSTIIQEILLFSQSPYDCFTRLLL